MPLPLGEVAERSEDGEGLPLPLGEVAEHSEDGEGEVNGKPLAFFNSYFFTLRC